MLPNLFIIVLKFSSLYNFQTFKNQYTMKQFLGVVIAVVVGVILAGYVKSALKIS